MKINFTKILNDLKNPDNIASAQKVMVDGQPLYILATFNAEGFLKARNALATDEPAALETEEITS